jgi:hypothetical protein
VGFSFFIFGAIIGSFLSMLIYRLPLNISLINPLRSFCPNCNKTISYKDSSLKDIMIKTSINLPIPIPLIDIKADVGYKQESLTVSKDLSDNLTSDIKFSGMFFGLSAKF